MPQMSQTEARVALALRDGPADVRQLGAAMGIDHTTLYIALHNLESAGVVARQQIRKQSGPKRPMHAWRLA